MQIWTDIKKNLTDNIKLALQLMLAVIAVYLFSTTDEHRTLKIPILFFGLLSWFLFRENTKHPILWFAFLGVLLIDLYFEYFKAANHMFLMIYMIMIAIVYFYTKRDDLLVKNVQILLIIVILSSALQKLMSSQFISGDFYYFMMNKGYFFKPLFNLNPEMMDIARSNYENIKTLEATDPNTSQHIILKNVIPNLAIASQIFAWITIIFESIVALAILYKPKSNWTHLLLSLMIIGVFMTRLENGFLALLAICGLLLTNHLKFRMVYVMLTLLCVTLIVAQIGFH